MRILFLHHFPLGQSEPGRLILRWRSALDAAGHETRVLHLAENDSDTSDPGVRTLVCQADKPAAAIPFELPRFASDRGAQAGNTFHALTDAQLTLYRDTIRLALDREMDEFNPDVIHAQHVWVQGQLALETGAAYVLNAWGPELAEYALDKRYRNLADQAAENAGRIIAGEQATLDEVNATFEGVADRLLLMDGRLNLSAEQQAAERQQAAAAQLIALYQTVLDERFG